MNIDAVFTLDRVKMRVWDKTRQEMLYSDTTDDPDKMLMHWDFKGSWAVTRAKDGFVINPNCAVLMFHVGLSDKTGVDVYSGDIITCPIKLWPRLMTWVVRYEGASFILQHTMEFAHSSLNMVPSLGMVIGNVFENPDFLKRR